VTYYGLVRELQESGIENAAFEADVMFCEICHVPRHELVFRRNEDFRSEELQEALQRRKKREPLQYILGHWYFYGLRFELNRDCLCPREDTELLVDLAIELVPQGARVIDIGTGSGAIAVALLCARKDLTAVLCDISEGALDCARINAQKNGVADRCTFVCVDALNKSELEALGRFDAVLSNPPYIKTDVIAGLAPELAYEPHRALDGGADGMIFYRSILDADVLSDGGIVIFEIGYDEGQDIIELAGTHNKNCTVKQDLGGNDRVAVIK